MTGNTCEGLGGGYNEYTMIIRSGTVTDNTALESAGGMFNYRSRSFSPCHDAIFVNSAPEGMILDIDNDGTKDLCINYSYIMLV